MAARKAAEPKRPRGRPTAYTAEIAAAICARLAQGESLRKICEPEDMPHEATVRHWAITDKEGFFTQYSHARDIGLDRMADETLEIADDTNGDVQRDRLRWDARRWYLSKMAPKRYGEKITQEVTGADGAPLVPILNVNISSDQPSPTPKAGGGTPNGGD